MILYLIIPCYNEQDVLPRTAPMFLNKINNLIKNKIIDDKSRILFVNDGSKDNTWNIILKLSKENEHFIGISQSRNRGHQNAVLAGLMEAKDKCDITVSIDCDGQDDINAIDKMVEAYKNGAEVVYGVRNNRDTDTWFKRNTAQLYYKLLNKLGGDIIYNHADYRLVSSKVLHYFAKYEEVNLFLRGLFPLIGFNSTCVYYERHRRIAGESHYPLKKMIALAFDGITSLSNRLIDYILYLGLAFIILGFFGMIIAAINKATQSTIILLFIVLISGIQIICIGVVGEYVGKTYLESKHRPRCIISEKTYAEGKKYD